MIASLIYLIGGVSVIASQRGMELKLAQRHKVVLGGYIGILIVISLITVLAFQRGMPESITLGGRAITYQNMMQGISTVFLLASSIIYLRVYYKSRTDLYYWYFLGLMSFAFGVFFISQGQVESKIAWSGRVAQYFGNLCFLIAVIGVYRRINHKNADLYYPEELNQNTTKKYESIHKIEYQ